MDTAHKNLSWTLTLLLLTGVLCNEWKVQYKQLEVCAVKGSFAVIPCSFYYPNAAKVQSVKWTHERNNIYTGPFIFDSGPRLRVVDLKIFVPNKNENETMKEGDSVNLTCINACDSSALTWFKNGEVINKGPGLYFSNISSTDSGNYTCSLKTQPGVTSRIININVEYGPKNTSVSVRPSMEVRAGSDITLLCSSDANPAVKNYTWFKMGHGNEIVGNGSKLHFREIHPRDGGQFLCRVSNKHGSQKSAIVSIKVKAYSSSLTRNVLIIATVAALLVGTTVIAIRRLNKKRSALRTSQETDDIQNPVYVNWPMFENNQPQQENHGEGKTTELIYASVDFSTNIKLEMQPQEDSHDDRDDVIYSTVCRAPQ
ncbi:hypothetical protein Q5P01_017315 [Channa striata]|uniref:Ig-like domain-containing protein n=1 Tax=Channa striata TaxID=64152 RepID=A0AA88MD29_CHASR|nr:hypothetical protein Q5P01_017315 [Channa striata]